ELVRGLRSGVVLIPLVEEPQPAERADLEVVQAEPRALVGPERIVAQEPQRDPERRGEDPELQIAGEDVDLAVDEPAGELKEGARREAVPLEELPVDEIVLLPAPGEQEGPHLDPGRLGAHFLSHKVSLPIAGSRSIYPLG